jgi:hypothetical protein
VLVSSPEKRGLLPISQAGSGVKISTGERRGMGLTGYTAEEIIGHLRKGLCTNQDLYDIVTEFRRKNPREDPLDVDDRAVGSW